MRTRAETQAQTRRRIVEAAVHLHCTIGPARTSFGGVAAASGLPRQTVYRHFADEAALFGACSTHYLQANPPPALADWLRETEPRERLRRALSDLYSYYRRNHAMLTNVLRDAAILASLQAFVAAYSQFQAAARDLLAPGWTGDQAAIKAVIGLALRFETWRSLVVEDDLSIERAVELMVALTTAAARPERGSAGSTRRRSRRRRT